MPGIYLHIPFCKQACHYCNFHFTTSLRRKNELVDALLGEIMKRKDFFENETISTIYFGGGTPSLLDTHEILRIMQSLHEHFKISAQVEVTFECNPDDVDEKKLPEWKSAGVNRLSMGVQSFYEEDLVWMNRAHNAAQSKTAIENAQQAGFENITIDLIYGLPQLTDEMWRNNVMTAINYDIPHLSCYALTVEPQTPLEKQIRQMLKPTIDNERQSQQFLLLMEWLNSEGYEHYEISNFAKPGFRSKHNSSYWRGDTYLGIGPSAHSFNGSKRQWNVANNNVYIDSMLNGQSPLEEEILTPVQQLNEYIMTSIRTIEGTDLDLISEKWGKETTASIVKDAKKYYSNGNLYNDDRAMKLTNEGKLFADGIASSLFRV